MDAYAGKVRVWLEGQLGSTVASHGGLVCIERPVTPKAEISSTRRTPTLSHSGFCYVLQKKCSFIIDSGSSCNIVRESLISELGLSCGEQQASKVAWVPFSMPNYGDCMRFVALENPPADLVLGRQWASDVRAVHHSNENQYKFQKNGIDITLNALPPSEVADSSIREAEGEQDHSIDDVSNINSEAAEVQEESSHAGKGAPRSARKRNRARTSQNTDGGDSEGQSESITGGKKRKRQPEADEDDEEEEEVSIGKKLWTFLIT